MNVRLLPTPRNVFVNVEIVALSQSFSRKKFWPPFILVSDPRISRILGVRALTLEERTPQ